MTSITENRSFSPITISGCTLWLDAADSSTITGTSSVTAWTDKSGLGNSPSFGANKPSYTGSFIETSNSNVDFTIPISTINTNSGQGGVLFFVFVDKQDNANYPALFSSGNPGQRFYQILLYNYGYEVSGNKLTQTGLDAMNTTNFILYSFTYVTGSSVSVRVNGSEILSSSVYAPNPSGQIYIGKDGWGDGTGNLKLKEILFFNTIFTDNQRQQIEGYLSWKWGLQRSLPGAHPNYSVNPSGPFPSFALATTAFKVKSNPAFFTPTIVAGCTLWLDGADPSATGIAPANNTNVSVWVDKSGLSNNYSGSANYTLDGTYNKYGLAFNGNGFSKSGGSTSVVTNSTYCIFTVHRFYSNYGGPGHIYRAGDRYWFRQHNANVNWITDLDPEGYIAVNANTTGINGIGCINTTTTTSATGYFNGTSVGSSLKGSGTNFSFNIGGEGLSANIFEILVYNIVLNDQQRQQVEGYLSWKWGIQALLSGAHPNFSVNGTIIAPFPSFAIATTPFKLQRAPFVDPTIKYSALFNTANNSSLTIPANAALTLGTNNHTIEFWLYQISRNTYAASFCYGNTTYFATNNYFMDVGQLEHGQVVVGNGAGGWAININVVRPTSLNVWNHYAVVRNGTTFTVYINGTSIGSANSSINIPAQGDVFKIGNTTGFPIAGYISNFRVVNGTAVYTSNFTPPTSPLTAIPNTQILLQGLTDRSPNAFTVTNNGGVTLSTTVSPFA